MRTAKAAKQPGKPRDQVFNKRAHKLLPGAQKGYAEGAQVDIKVTLQKGGKVEAQEVAAPVAALHWHLLLK